MPTIRERVDGFLHPETRVVYGDNILPGWGATATNEGGYSRLAGADPERAMQIVEGWTYSAIDAIADTSARIPIELYLQRPGMSDPSEWQRVDQHPALTLLETPNPVMDEFELRYITQAWLDIWGNALWHLVRLSPGSEPVEIWPVPWHWMERVKGADGRVIAMRYRGARGLGKKDIPIEDLIHFKRPNPASAIVGRGVILGIAKAIDLRFYMMEQRLEFFRNGATMGEVITAPATTPQEQITRFYAEFAENHRGVKRSWMPMVFRNGWKAETRNDGKKESDWIESLEQTVDEILAGLRTPRAVLGISKDYNRANLDGAVYAFQKFAIEPRLSMFTRKLRAEYFNAPQWKPSDGSVYQPEAEDFIDRDEAQARAWIQVYLGNGTGVPLMTPNQARAYAGLKPEANSDLDRYYVSGNVRPIDEPPAGPVGMTRAATPAIKEKSARPFSKGDAIWKRFSIAHAKHEREILRGYKTAFAEQENLVLRRARRIYGRLKALVAGDESLAAGGREAEEKALIDSIFPSQELEAKRVAGVVDPAKMRALRAAAKETSKKISKGIKAEDDFEISPILEVTFEEWINDVGLSNITAFDEVTAERLRRTISGVIADGGGIDDIVAAIGDEYDDIERWRALRIARTETTGAWGFASIEQARESGVEMRKIWIAAQDERTRDDHDSAAEEYGEGGDPGPIPIDEPFSVGSDFLDYPGDPSGSAENVINCRCTIAYIVTEGDQS